MRRRSIVRAVPELKLDVDERHKHGQWRRVTSLHEQRQSLT